MEQYKEKFIELMIDADVLRFGEFKTKSGRLSPFFINTGNYRTGAHISALGDFYAETIREHVGPNFTALYGPAYKGIPLAVAAASSLYNRFGIDVHYCFNRKEAKDHGEGGTIIGYQPKSGDRLVIVEDVITAGTAVRETLDVLKHQGDITIEAVVVSVNRMERGQGTKTALQELEDEFGIRTLSIVTIEEIVQYLHNNPVFGRVWIDDHIKAKIDDYRRQFGA